MMVAPYSHLTPIETAKPAGVGLARLALAANALDGTNTALARRLMR